MKIVKKTWIAILAVATAVVAACTTTKRSPENAESDIKHNDNDNLNIDGNSSLTKDSISAKRAELQERLEKLRATIKDREMSCVYGSPEVMKKYNAETRAMRNEADSLQNELLNELALEKSGLQERLDSIDNTIKGRSGAKVYGSPEVIDRYQSRNRELQENRDAIRNEIDRIDSEINNIQNNK